MNRSRFRFVCAAIFGLAFALAGDSPTGSAETTEQIIAAAKKEETRSSLSLDPRPSVEKRGWRSSKGPSIRNFA